jgi:hypothetical protein
MKQKGRSVMLIISLVLIVFVLFLYLPYRRDINNKYAQLASIDRQVIETNCGQIEAAVQGEGEVVLVSHGIGGGFDQGLGLAKAYLGATPSGFAP